MIREQRKKKRRRKIGLTVVLILLMLLAIAFLIVWKVFTVENVVVEGNELYSSEQIVEASQIQPGDNLLLVDDFLANGKALEGLIDLVQQAGATVVGAGIAVEKAFQPGGERIRAKGVRVESLARVKEMHEGEIVFC